MSGLERWDAPLTWRYFETTRQRHARYDEERRELGIVFTRDKPIYNDERARYAAVLSLTDLASPKWQDIEAKRVHRLAGWRCRDIRIVPYPARAVANRAVRLMRQIHCYRDRQRGLTYRAIATKAGVSPERMRQIIATEHRRRMIRWRQGGGSPFVRGTHPVQTEPWND